MKTPNKTWGIMVLATLFLLLVGLGGLTVAVDPYFHYHKPLDTLQYRLYDERYINDGILKHFDYDAIITGTSMTENFKASEFGKLFNVQPVKVPFSGAGYKEINENLERALAKNPDLKTIVRGLDYNRLCSSADWARYSADLYPDYLYDNKLHNDVKYIFNKSILFDKTIFTLSYTKNGNKTTTFDAYSNWMEGKTFGKEAVLATYNWADEIAENTAPFTEEDRQVVFENITQNVTALVEQHPEVDFYFFFTPYSICYFHQLYQGGTLERQLEIEKYAIELMLQHDNIHLFSFFTEFDMITDLDNYKDVQHYGEDVNSQMLLWMREGYGELTSENYEEYCKQVRDFYTNYDYSTLSVS